jgi:TetR/AcrR family transcriptional repressor of nem operon
MARSATAPNDSKQRLLEAALVVIRTRGYEATRVDDVCAEAGLSKGSFFHHFASKQDMALESAQFFSDMADTVFATAPYQAVADPRERLLGYVDFRIAILQGELSDFTCLLGTMVQETFVTHPAIRQACERFIRHHAKQLETVIADAKNRFVPHAPWTPDSLALHTQAVIQGAFILAKATGRSDVAAESLRHLRRYLEAQFKLVDPKETAWPPSKRSRPSSGTTRRPRKRPRTT